nr:glycosyltransferase [Brevundimonas variabilis]
MARLGIASSLEHFLLVGQARGWSVNPPLAERTVAPDDGRALFEKRGRRAYGEIIDGEITIPPAVAPRLSVIVPVFNQADLTAGFLKSAAFAIEILRSRRGIETEIIVIDNGSRDHTVTLLAALPSVRVEQLSAPFSFPAAVNSGAALARGDVFLVVNNDIEVQPDAFDRVFGVLDGDASVGVLGAKIILPNDTLQEVGASIDRLGNTEGFGRGMDVFRLRSNRRIEVDYASGCFIAFRRSDFEALSGFEGSFAPGYYEDVDFALRMKRDLGKVTVVDAGLAVMHYENASFAKGRPASANMTGALRNRRHLKSAHAARFRAMQPPSPPERAARSRDALFGPFRVLMITDSIPAARLGSGPGRQEAILDRLAEMDIAFDILALKPDVGIDHYKDPRAEVFRAWMPGQSFDETLHRHAAGYSHLWICGASTLSAHAVTVAWARISFGLKVICDVGALSSLEAIERLRLDKGVEPGHRLLSTLDDELTHATDVDHWVAVDHQDRALIEQIGLGPVVEIGHSPRVLGTAIPDRSFTDRNRILFVGGVHDFSSPSHDALEWVLRDIWPRLGDLDGVRLTLAGQWNDGLSDDFRQRFGDRIEMLGALDDVQLVEVLGQTRVVLAPDRFSRHYPAGVVEAVRAGVPTVMTDHVAVRLGLATNPAIAVGQRDDGGQSFAEWVARLYSDKKAWRAQLKEQQSSLELSPDEGGLIDQVKAALGIET